MQYKLFHNVGCFIKQYINHKEEKGDWFAVLTGVVSFAEENKLDPLLHKAQKSFIRHCNSNKIWRNWSVWLKIFFWLKSMSRLHFYNFNSADLFTLSFKIIAWFLEVERFQLVLHAKHSLFMEILNMRIYL